MNSKMITKFINYLHKNDIIATVTVIALSYKLHDVITIIAEVLIKKINKKFENNKSEITNLIFELLKFIFTMIFVFIFFCLIHN